MSDKSLVDGRLVPISLGQGPGFQNRVGHARWRVPSAFSGVILLAGLKRSILGGGERHHQGTRRCRLHRPWRVVTQPVTDGWATIRPEPTRLGRAALETCLGLFSPVEHLERCWHLTVCQWTEPDSAANVVGSFFRFFARLAPLRLAETLPIAHESLASIQL